MSADHDAARGPGRGGEAAAPSPAQIEVEKLAEYRYEIDPDKPKAWRTIKDLTRSNLHAIAAYFVPCGAPHVIDPIRRTYAPQKLPSLQIQLHELLRRVASETAEYRAKAKKAEADPAPPAAPDAVAIAREQDAYRKGYEAAKALYVAPAAPQPGAEAVAEALRPFADEAYLYGPQAPDVRGQTASDDHPMIAHWHDLTVGHFRRAAAALARPGAAAGPGLAGAVGEADPRGNDGVIDDACRAVAALLDAIPLPGGRATWRQRAWHRFAEIVGHPGDASLAALAGGAGGGSALTAHVHPDAVQAARRFADDFLTLAMAYSSARIEAWEDGTFSDKEHVDARRDLRVAQGKHAEMEHDFTRWWAPRDGFDGPIRALTEPAPPRAGHDGGGE